MMVDYRLSNVLLAGPHYENYPDMYVRKSPAGLLRGSDEAFQQTSATRFDFATYFNALSLYKWQKFANIGEVTLHIEAKGRYEIVLVGYRPSNHYPVRVEFSRVSHDDAAFETCDYTYPSTDCTLLAFEVIASDSFELKGAYYFTTVDEQCIRDVELAVATTTYCKEDYVKANMQLCEREVLGCDEPVAKHFTMHVIDNGRTLDAEALSTERIIVHPNPNTGGSGGFARGMIEGMAQEVPATHVLLMDDDVQICPEAFKRTFNMLTLVKDEYREFFVSGAMLWIEKPDQFHEDIGFVNPQGYYGPTKTAKPPKWHITVSDLEDMMMLETHHYEFKNNYAAWWYCAIPVTTIKKDGLPLPIFIRADDAEYSNRAAKGIISMNGICVWHQSNMGVFSATLDRYYLLRNNFIAQAANKMYTNVDFMYLFHFSFGIDIKTFNYDAAEMCIKALEDFVAGPERLKHIQTAEFNASISHYNEKLRDVDELLKELPEKVEFNPNGLYHPQFRNLRNRLYDFVTANGQRGPAWLARRGGVAVIPYDGLYYGPNDVRGKDMVLALTANGTKGVLRRKDRARAQELLKRYAALRKDYKNRKDEIDARWADAQHELTSLEFWKWYLNDQAKHIGMDLEL